jgi:hypothetical protein
MKMLRFRKFINIVLKFLGYVAILFANPAYADFLGNTTNPPSFEDFSKWGGEVYVRSAEVDPEHSDQWGFFYGFEQTIVLPVIAAELESITLYDLYDQSGPEFVTFTINDTIFNVTNTLPYGADITPIVYDLKGIAVEKSFTLKFSAVPGYGSSAEGKLLLSSETGDFLPIVRNEVTINFIDPTLSRYFSYKDKPLLFGLYYSPLTVAVPEPESLVMLMAGLGLVGLRKRRKKFNE